MSPVLQNKESKIHQAALELLHKDNKPAPKVCGAAAWHKVNCWALPQFVLRSWENCTQGSVQSEVHEVYKVHW